ncbi:MAG: hypothetical protein SFU56_15640 [Capsulimonadales bacterium]|nr:hypothetical protein [Capsulimonadales bacterium]
MFRSAGRTCARTIRHILSVGILAGICSGCHFLPRDSGAEAVEERVYMDSQDAAPLLTARGDRRIHLSVQQDPPATSIIARVPGKKTPEILFQGEKDRAFLQSLVTPEEILLLFEARNPEPPAPGFRPFRPSPLGGLLIKGFPAISLSPVDPVVYRKGEKPKPEERRETVRRVPKTTTHNLTVVRLRIGDRPGSDRVTRSSLIVRGAGPITLTPAGICWVRPETTVVTRVVPTDPALPMYLEAEPKDTLALTDWSGKTRVIRRNCLIRDMSASADRVYWSEMGEPGEIAPRRYEMVPGDPDSVRALPIPPALQRRRKESPNPTGSPNPMEPSPVMESLIEGTNVLRYGDRYYWFEGSTGQGKQRIIGFPDGREWYYDADSEVVLMTAREDGSDVRSMGVLRDADGKTVRPFAFVRDGEKGYILRNMVEERNGKPYQSTWIARVHPDRSGAPLGAPRFVTDVADFNRGTLRITGGYLYFSYFEKRKETLDFLKDRSTERAYFVLRRVRLPE